MEVERWHTFDIPDRLLLAKLGVSPAELLQQAPARPAVPTFAEYLPVVRAAVGPGTLRAYSTVVGLGAGLHHMLADED